MAIPAVPLGGLLGDLVDAGPLVNRIPLFALPGAGPGWMHHVTSSLRLYTVFARYIIPVVPFL